MVQRFGYFNSYRSSTEFGVTTCIVREQLKTLPNEIPSGDEDYDCYRVSIVDGSLVIELWETMKKKFSIVLITSNFKLKHQ